MEHVDWIPRKWRSGTRGLTYVEKIIYFEICNEIYLLGEAIPEDHKWLAAICDMPLPMFRRGLEVLVAKGKISKILGENLNKLMANHCEEELKACSHRMDTSRKNGKRGGRPPKNQQVSITPGFPDEKPLGSGHETQGVCNKTQQNNYPLSPQDLREGEAAEPSPEAQAPDDPPPAIQTAAEGDESASGDDLQAAPVGKVLPPLTSMPAQSARALGSNPRALGSNPRNRPPPAIPPSPAPTGPPEVVAMFEALRAEIGEAAFRAWIAPLEVGAVNGAVRLHAPSRFHRDHVDGHWGDRMRTIIGCLVEIDVAATERRG